MACFNYLPYLSFSLSSELINVQHKLWHFTIERDFSSPYPKWNSELRNNLFRYWFFAQTQFWYRTHMFRIYVYRYSVLFRRNIPNINCSEVIFRRFHIAVLLTIFKGVYHKRFMWNTPIHMSREPAVTNNRKMSLRVRTLNRTQSTASLWIITLLSRPYHSTRLHSPTSRFKRSFLTWCNLKMTCERIFTKCMNLFLAVYYQDHKLINFLNENFKIRFLRTDSSPVSESSWTHHRDIQLWAHELWKGENFTLSTSAVFGGVPQQTGSWNWVKFWAIELSQK